jgi:lipopolysaccharide transport system permease protein
MTATRTSSVENRSVGTAPPPGEVVLSSRRKPPAGLGALVATMVTQRDLVWQMAKREVVGRYKGSVLGLVWSFFYPLLQLAVYTFAFAYVFNVSPKGPVTTRGGMAEFAFYAFSGLILFSLFTEVVTRSPLVILQNANYVKKVVFPLEIFPCVYLVSSLIHGVISLVVLLGALVAVHHYLPMTALAAPLAVLPLALFILGLGWFLSSLGVYLRDVAQTVGIFTMMLMYLSPVFYTLEMIKNPILRLIIRCNPLTIPLISFRHTLLDGQWPEWEWLGGYFVVSLLFAWAGFAFFQRTKRGFADVL